MEIEVTCPLRSKCEEVKDNKVHRCRWYINIRGKHPQSEDIIDQWDCSMAWMPIVMVENAQTNRGQTQAIESFRNEMIRNQKEFNLTLLTEVDRRRKLEQLEEKVSLMLLEENERKRLVQKPSNVIEIKEEE